VEWEEGLRMFLQNDKIVKILKAIPKRNRKDLLSNMRQYSYLKARAVNLDEVIEPLLDDIEELLET
jgi:hypothetical protein